jgi:hypothetical protein
MRTNHHKQTPCLLTIAALASAMYSPVIAADEILLADFEGGNHGTWKAEGSALKWGQVRMALT